MNSFFPRKRLQEHVYAAMTTSPVTALLGPRQSGKTWPQVTEQANTRQLRRRIKLPWKKSAARRWAMAAKGQGYYGPAKAKTAA